VLAMPPLAVGWLLLLTLLAFLGASYGPLSPYPAAALAWAAGLLVLPRVDRGTRRVAGVLLLLGVGCAALAWRQGFGFPGTTGMGRAFTINLPILALFLGVAFLGLLPAEASRSTARGTGLLGLLLSVHLVGAVINLAAAALVGDSFARDRRKAPRLTRAEALAITRPYCAAAFWSPFFVATAVAQTYAPAAKASVTLPLGFLAALGALVITYITLRREGAGAHLGSFQLGRRALGLTAVLLLAVLGGKAIYPDVSVVIMVATLAPPLAFLSLPRFAWAGAARALLAEKLPATAAQHVLFLAAGVFAFGVSTLLDGWLAGQGGETFVLGLWAYPLTTAAIVGTAYLGVHPVISIAAAASILTPLGGDPSQMAFAFVAGWGIGTAVAPLSGMNLFMTGRYGVRPREILRWSPGYAGAMLLWVSLLMLGGQGLRSALN
jgi:hypothetical protein